MTLLAAVILALAVVVVAATAPAGEPLEVEIGTALTCERGPAGEAICTESP